MVNPEWLRYFVALSQAKSFAAAAEQLHITPQAMSNAIAGLEQHYGQRLIVRDQRAKGLTPAGEMLLHEARRILQAHDDAERTLADLLAGAPQGPVRIAANSLFGHHVLPPALALLVQRFPKVRPRVVALGTAEGERGIADGEIDLAFVPRKPLDKRLAFQEVLTCPYVIVGRPQATVSWQELAYIVPAHTAVREGDCRSEEALDDAWSDTHHPRRIVAEVEQLETAIRLSETGLGAVFVPRIAVADRLARGDLAILAEAPQPYHETFGAVWRQGERLPAVSALLTILVAAFPEAEAARP